MEHNIESPEYPEILALRLGFGGIENLFQDFLNYYFKVYFIYLVLQVEYIKKTSNKIFIAL